MLRSSFFAVWIPLALIVYIPRANARQTPSAIQKGYIRLVSDNGTSSPAGVAIFGLRSNGVLVTEAGVPSSTPIRSGRIFAEIGGPVNTGIALANPKDQDTTIAYKFTDNTGRDFGAGTFTLPAKHQIAAFLNEQPFGPTLSLTGTFTFNSSSPVAAVALRSFVNERGEVLMTTVPVSPLGSGFGGTALLIPHFGDVGNSTTQVVLVNPGDTPLAGSIQFFGTGSKALPTQPTKVVVNGVTNSTFNYTIPPRSVSRMLAQVAWYYPEIGLVRITPAPSETAPSGLAILSYQNGETTVSTTSVAALPAAKALRMYIESSGALGQNESMQTGLSIWNPSAARVIVQLDVMNFDGTPTGLSTSVDTSAGGQIVKFAKELFPQLPSTFKGVLRITAPSSVAVVGLRGRYNERGDLLMTTTPPYDEAALPVSETDFPHFVSGGGYYTQLILLSTGPAQTGSLWLLSQDGISLPSSTVQPNP